jgi:NAD(P)-dependent dehydrogenase (short-subunit alcohol dehydrogenase family)
VTLTFVAHATSDVQKESTVSEERTPVAVVVGASGVTGRAVSRRLAHDGFRVALADAVGLEETAANLTDVADALLGTYVVDLTSEDSVMEFSRKLASDAAVVDAVAIVAAVQQRGAAAVTSLDVADWDRVLSVNLRGPFLAAKWLAPMMVDSPSASLVTVGSWWGYEGHAFFSAYCASKAGLRSLTQALAEELAPDGIRVNMLAPGNIDTPMHHGALRTEAEKRGIALEEMQRIEWDKIPLGKPAAPEQIASALSFLLGPDSSYMTGSVLDVNGGVVFR